ncbi:PREDICTED: translation initiation factor eIF-2B subunit delta-like [Branchiostoma belcheri]|uniref:Translation initiation factor eIF2B subunit delta n=1 Tax=Branchiostoma belcheri TaxID=7741 RepID=A0A6P4YVU7_BRABE|nr:PREDICTED: translation initiation factor eIF-2B subunit delta-like [Branchiostoma belcheri]
MADEQNNPGAEATEAEQKQLSRKERKKEKRAKKLKGKEGEGGGERSSEATPQGHGGQGATSAGGQDVTKPQKSKAELKAERRAKQEADRAAKQAKKSGEGGGKDPGTVQKPRTGSDSNVPSSPSMQVTKKEAPRVRANVLVDDPNVQKKVAKRLETQRVPQRPVTQKKVGLFSHLHQYERETSLTKNISFSPGGIHSAILKLGLQYANGIICGSNSRCLALLVAFKKVIADYTTPTDKDLSRDLDAKIKPYISFLTQCRPLSVSMGNAIKYIKWQINHSPNDIPEAEAKKQLQESIDLFIKEKILLAGEAISKTYTLSKIHDGDVILVYGFSSLIKKVLCDAHDSGKKFSVVVVDGRPKFEGKEMLRRLVRHGIKCTYVLINAVSYIMQEVSKVLLGAHALLANGFVMGRVGTSLVAMTAKACNVPVLVCCETYKFCERVQTDSFVFNELGDPDDLVPLRKQRHLDTWRQQDSLHLLNLVYDITPSNFIAMVITEVGMIPCTSVPVILRVKSTEVSEE